MVFCRDNLRLGEERRPLVGRISERSRSQGQRFVLEPVRFVGADLLRRQFRVDWVRYRPGTRKCFISLEVFFSTGKTLKDSLLNSYIMKS